MGNIHRLVQTEPSYDTDGFGVLVRPSHVDSVRERLRGKVSHLMHLVPVRHRVTLDGGRGWVDLPTDRWRVVVESGSKDSEAYKSALSTLRAIAPGLEPAVGYLQDEAARFLTEIAIANGKAVVREIAYLDARVGLHLAEHHPQHAGLACELLYETFPEFYDDDEEGVREATAIVETLLRVAPTRWQTMHLRAKQLAFQKAWPDAVTVLRAALAQPGIDASSRAQMLSHLVTAQSMGEAREALATAREAFDTWRSTKHKPGLEALATLEELCGDRRRALDAWRAVLGTRDCGREAYDNAVLRALRGDHEACLDWLRVALAVAPEYRALAARDPDLALVRGTATYAELVAGA